MELQPKSKLNKIVFLLLQEIDPQVIDSIIKHTEPLFNAKCQIEKLNLDLNFAYHQKRKQYNSTSILAYLKPITAKNTYSLAIFNQDLYASNTSFVFGEAEVGGRVGIVSLARLGISSSDDFLALFACKEVTHELGHIVGLRHCETKRCVMSFSSNLVEVEKKSAKFCPDCAHSLAYLAFLNKPS